MNDQQKLLAAPPPISGQADPLLSAIQFAHENDIWPSSRNIATLLGYQNPKLDGRMNARRRQILRETFYF